MRCNLSTRLRKDGHPCADRGVDIGPDSHAVTSRYAGCRFRECHFARGGIRFHVFEMWVTSYPERDTAQWNRP